MNVYVIKHQSDIDKPYYKTMLSDEVKKNLLKTGKAGQLIPIKTNDEEIKVYQSIDNQTNELFSVIAFRTKIPNIVNK